MKAGSIPAHGTKRQGTTSVAPLDPHTGTANKLTHGTERQGTTSVVPLIAPLRIGAFSPCDLLLLHPNSFSRDTAGRAISGVPWPLRRSQSFLDMVYPVDYTFAMFSVRPLPEFTAWLDGLKDNRVRGAVAERIKRLTFGLLGDFKAIGDGVMELRIDFGAGWRIYYTQRGAQIVVLLAGGSKRTQKRDIKRAKALAASLEYEGDKR
jgi:putative addiction module killer protein